MFKQLKIK